MPDLYPLADGLYAFPGDARTARPWLGVVVTTAGTVLVDSGNGPRQAADLQAALDRIAAPPVTHVLLTHHHWDHVFGTAFFPDAHVVAHELTQRHLRVMAAEPWSRAYVEAKGDEFPRGRIVARWMNAAVPDWSAFRAVPADETFSDRYDLSLGRYHLTMEHVGGQHEPDQCLVHVQPGNVLFLGDYPYGRGPERAWDRPALARDLRDLLDRGAAWYVEGHRTPARPDRFAARIARLEPEA